MVVSLPCVTSHSVCCCRPGSIVAKFYLIQGLLLYTWQHCCLVLPITMSVAEDLAVLLPCAFSSSSSSLSQCLLLYTLQYCCHVLPIIVSVAVDLSVLLPCFSFHSVCCCRLGSIVSNVTMFYQSHCLLLTWQYC